MGKQINIDKLVHGLHVFEISELPKGLVIAPGFFSGVLNEDTFVFDVASMPIVRASMAWYPQKTTSFCSLNGTVCLTTLTSVGNTGDSWQ